MPASDLQRSRILILEADRKTGPQLLQFAVNDFANASVQSIACGLPDIAGDSERFRRFDVVLAGCDFSGHGGSDNPVFQALRGLSADPQTPPVILLAARGSEFTAAQAIRAGAFDYLPKGLFGREQIRASIQAALDSRGQPGGAIEIGSGPRVFGYDLRRCLAATDNASIHMAYSAEQGCEVVVKLLNRGRGPLSRDNRFAQFVEEFKILHDIDDPAVAEIYDFRVTPEFCYIAMEHFDRGHLGRRLRDGVDLTEALKITKEIAGALSIIHMAGIVHRDLKPGNIMLRRDGSVALIDFGIASNGGPGGGDGWISGTPYYMSPEQADGRRTDERTDLYALGVILCEMLTGEKPFTGDDVDAILDAHRHAPLPSLDDELAPCEPVIHRLLAKQPAQRLASARELVGIVESLIERDYALSASSAGPAARLAKS